MAVEWPRPIRAVADRFGVDPPAASRRSVLVASLAFVVLLAAAPFAAAVVVLVGSSGGIGRVRARRRRRGEQIQQQLPDALDVIGLSIRAGLVPVDALTTAAGVSTAPLDALLGDSVARLARGAAWRDVVESLAADLGPDGRGVALLLSGDGGAPLAEGLARLADELRDRRRRDVQRRAQRLPVVVLAPLITCILPAFGLVTILPLVSTLGQDVVGELPLDDSP